jgi:hypothetical protein
VEELEKRVAIAAVEYKKNCDDYWETYTFDPTYFDTFISGDLYNVFLNAIYERIKPLNDFEINKYLTLSVNQFKTHTPTKRAEVFKRIFHDTYWYPNYMDYNPNQYENKYPVHVWKHYANHFHLFKEASENVLQDFKKGLIGNGRKQEMITKTNPVETNDKKSNHKQGIDNDAKNVVEKINSLSKFEFVIELDKDNFHIDKSVEIIQQQYFNYTEAINSTIKAKFLDGNIDFLKRLLIQINDSIKQWELVKKDDELYFNITFANEKYRNLTDNIEVNYITETKLYYLNDIKKNLVNYIGKEERLNGVPNKKPKSKHQSFTYINNITGHTQLTDLMNALKRINLIENSTDLKDFRKAFSGEEIEKPIVWTGNISELSYFIKQLHNELKLVKDLKQQQWEVTNNCFVKTDGSQFGRHKFKGQKRPTTFKNIDLALKTLQ